MYKIHGLKFVLKRLSEVECYTSWLLKSINKRSILHWFHKGFIQWSYCFVIGEMIDSKHVLKTFLLRLIYKYISLHFPTTVEQREPESEV